MSTIESSLGRCERVIPTGAIRRCGWLRPLRYSESRYSWLDRETARYTPLHGTGGVGVGISRSPCGARDGLHATCRGLWGLGYLGSLLLCLTST